MDSNLDFSTVTEVDEKGKVGDFVKKVVIPKVILPIIKDIILK